MIQAITFILLITFGIGLPLTLLIAPKHNIIGRLGLSYLLGIGIFTLLMFATNLLGLKLTFANNILIFLFAATSLIFFGRMRLKGYWKDFKKSFKSFHPGLTEKVTIGAIGYFIVSSFANTFYWPVYIWDALTLYDFRGHLFAQTGFIQNTITSLNSGYYFSYPLFTSLSHTIVYLSGGANSQFIYSLFYLSLGLSFYGLLREFISKKIGILFTLMLLTVPQIFNQSVVSYTNLPSMTFFSLGAIYFYIWDKKRTPGYLILSSLLVGLSTWTRSAEPFWLGIFMLVVLLSLLRKKILDILVFSIFFFPIQQMWKVCLSNVTSQTSTLGQISSYFSVLSNAFDFQRWTIVISFLYRNVVKNWGPVFILFIAVFVYSLIAKKIKNEFMIYLITFTLFAMLFVGTFIFSFTFPTWSEIPDSASRTAMIFYPLFVYCASLFFA